jgi:hypothetical protein
MKQWEVVQAKRKTKKPMKKKGKEKVKNFVKDNPHLVCQQSILTPFFLSFVPW